MILGPVHRQGMQGEVERGQIFMGMIYIARQVSVIRLSMIEVPSADRLLALRISLGIAAQVLA